MRLRSVVPAFFLLLATSAVAVPPPPPPPEEEGQLRNFVKALPKRIPQDLESFAPVVSQNVKVYREGKLAFASREAWFAFLRGYGGKLPDDPQGISVSRESLYRLSDDGIATMEFSYPIAPAGREGQIIYDPQFPLQLVTYFVDGGKLARVEYGHPMRSFDYLLAEAGLQPPAPTPCPAQPQPEPAPLSVAGLGLLAEGDSILFSAAPSWQKDRYAMRIIRRPNARSVWATLLRLRRQDDCNVLDRTGTWDFELTPEEADSLYRTVAALERQPPNTEVVLDGTSIEVQHYAFGKFVLKYSSNGRAAEALSEAILNVARKHVPAAELPSLPDWRIPQPAAPLKSTRG